MYAHDGILVYDDEYAHAIAVINGIAAFNLAGRIEVALGIGGVDTPLAFESFQRIPWSYVFVASLFNEENNEKGDKG